MQSLHHAILIKILASLIMWAIFSKVPLIKKYDNMLFNASCFLDKHIWGKQENSIPMEKLENLLLLSFFTETLLYFKNNIP